MRQSHETGGPRPAVLRTWLYALLLAPLAFALHACGEETPTDVGGSLLPADALRTIEVILEPAAFYDIDTTFTGFAETRSAGFQIVAHEFGGVFESNTLARFTVPTRVSTLDSTGASVTDTMPALLGGRVVIAVDTSTSDVTLPVTIGLYRIEEEWDPVSADWNNRIDTAGVTLAWSQPGGRGGTFVDSVVWSMANVDTAGNPVDSLVIDVDSQTIALWSDATMRARGGLIAMETSGARVRIADILLRVDVRPSVKPDTLLTVTVRPDTPRFIHDPQVQRQANEFLVGGIPEWRTYLRWRSGLDTVSLPCPQISAGCVIRLADANINYAALILTLTEPPPGFLPQDTSRIITAPVLASTLTPLERSPLAPDVGVGIESLAADRFRNPVGDETEVPVTSFLRRLLADTTFDGAPVSPWMALLPILSGIDIGVAAFEPAPRLRLILTVARELQLR
ncbi:MAG TPA: hypothetical protein VMM79_20255 [Longimicrobiales bacterium]|nr:hypothetical protein [Longimicrobiales bacterium]